MTIRMCQICKKKTNRKANAKYCKECADEMQKNGAYRFRIGENTWVWVKGSLKLAMQNGQVVEPILEGYEVKEWV